MSPPVPDGTAVFRRRGYAGATTLYAFAWALLWTGFPIFACVAMLAVAYLGDRPQVPAWFAIPIVGVFAPFILGGVPLVLDSLTRIRVAFGPTDALSVGPTGIAIGTRPILPWGAISEIRVGRTSVVEGRYSHPDRPQLEIVPVDPAFLRARPWTERASAAYGAWFRRLKPFGDRRPRPIGLRVDLDLLEPRPDVIIDLIATYRPVEMGRRRVR